MDVAELQRRVDKVAKIDLRPLYDAYVAEAGARATQEGFLAFLGRTQAVDVGVLKELHATGDVEITRGPTDASYAATIGGGAASPANAWAACSSPRGARAGLAT